MTTLPTDFIVYWRRLVASFDGRAKAAHRHLLHCFRTGKKIPGYDFADAATAPVPRGWSYANLLRLRPTKTALRFVAVRVEGSAAAISQGLATAIAEAGL